MGTAIILIILIVVILFAVRSSLKHMRGEGGCCGGSGPEKKIKRKKLEKIVAEKRLTIEDMTCDNCRIRVENALNALEHVNAKVNLEKKEAIIKMDAEVSDETLKAAVEKAGYRVG